MFKRASMCLLALIASAPGSGAPIPPAPIPNGPSFNFSALPDLLNEGRVDEYLGFFGASVTVFENNKMAATGIDNLRQLTQQWKKDGWRFKLVQLFRGGNEAIALEIVTNMPTSSGIRKQTCCTWSRAIRYVANGYKIVEIDILNAEGASTPGG